MADRGLSDPVPHDPSRATKPETDQFWAEADPILLHPEEPARVAAPERVRARLIALLERAAASDAPGGDVQQLKRIAGGENPVDVFASPAAFAEEIAIVRCLIDSRHPAEQLQHMRTYVEQAATGDVNADLAADRSFVREQLSFVTLLEEPHRFDALRATFDIFREEYARAYLRHHNAYWQAAARVQASLEEAQAAAKALRRLNTLRSLGAPVGGSVLDTYERLRARDPCTAAALERSLREQPACPTCGIALDDTAPVKESARVLQELRAALAIQQSRLASEAVRRILARGAPRLDRFLEIVQAADIGGLAQVLDDELLGFLRDLLAEPVTPTPEAVDLFEQLARAYPVIDEAQIDAVVDTLRQLLAEAIARQTGDPARPASFRLASRPPP